MDSYLHTLRFFLPYSAGPITPSSRLVELGLEIDSVDVFRLLTQLCDELGKEPKDNGFLVPQDFVTAETLWAALTKGMTWEER